jgi:hypothetical protein
MGLESLWRTRRRTVDSVRAQRLFHPGNSGAPNISRSFVFGNLQKLHSEFRGTGSDLSRRGRDLPEGTRAVCREFQLLALPTFALGENS